MTIHKKKGIIEKISGKSEKEVFILVKKLKDESLIEGVLDAPLDPELSKEVKERVRLGNEVDAINKSFSRFDKSDSAPLYSFIITLSRVEKDRIKESLKEYFDFDVYLKKLVLLGEVLDKRVRIEASDLGVSYENLLDFYIK